MKKRLGLRILKKLENGGQGIGVLAFYSDNPSSNPPEVYRFKELKWAGDGPSFFFSLNI